jgi:hypothetical protein
LFVAYWGSVTAVDVTGAGPVAVGAVALVVVVCSLRQRLGVAVGVAGIGWVFVTGFVANAGGALAVHGPADAVRLLLLVSAGVAAAALTRRGAR